MSKYDSLYSWLRKQRSKNISVTFHDLEGVLGFKLPVAARNCRAWWANERSPSTHTHCNAWLDAGFETEHVDMPRETLVFRMIQGNTA